VLSAEDADHGFGKYCEQTTKRKVVEEDAYEEGSTRICSPETHQAIRKLNKHHDAEEDLEG